MLLANYQDPRNGEDTGWRNGEPPTYAYWNSPAEIAHAALVTGRTVAEIRAIRGLPVQPDDLVEMARTWE